MWWGLKLCMQIPYVAVCYISNVSVLWYCLPTLNHIFLVASPKGPCTLMQQLMGKQVNVTHLDHKNCGVGAHLSDGLIPQFLLDNNLVPHITKLSRAHFKEYENELMIYLLSEWSEFWISSLFWGGGEDGIYVHKYLYIVVDMSLCIHVYTCRCIHGHIHF